MAHFLLSSLHHYMDTTQFCKWEKGSLRSPLIFRKWEKLSLRSPLKFRKWKKASLNSPEVVSFFWTHGGHFSSSFIHSHTYKMYKIEMKIKRVYKEVDHEIPHRKKIGHR